MWQWSSSHIPGHTVYTSTSSVKQRLGSQLWSRPETVAGVVSPACLLFVWRRILTSIVSFSSQTGFGPQAAGKDPQHVLRSLLVQRHVQPSSRRHGRSPLSQQLPGRLWNHANGQGTTCSLWLLFKALIHFYLSNYWNYWALSSLPLVLFCLIDC